MARFTTAPVEMVVPQHRRMQPSRQSLQRQEYCEVLERALSDGKALVIDLEPDDDARNMRYRMRVAAHALGYENVVVRRKGSQMFAYREDEDGVSRLPSPKMRTERD